MFLRRKFPSKDEIYMRRSYLYVDYKLQTCAVSNFEEKPQFSDKNEKKI